MVKRIALMGFVALVFWSMLGLVQAQQDKALTQKRKLAIIPLNGIIDWHMLKTVERRLGEAKKWGAEQYLFEINSYGGYLDAVDDIADLISQLSGADTRTTAFIMNKSLSGGAYLAMACDEIAMQPHATMGDVMPIMVPLQDMPADVKEKYRSPVRARFANYAKQHNYPEALAKAMVDPDVEVVEVEMEGPNGKEKFYVEGRVVEEWIQQKEAVEGYREKSRITVVAEGELLTMGAAKAIEYGFSKYNLAAREELLEKLAEVYYTEATGEVKAVSADEVFEISVFVTNWWEGFVWFLTSPIVKMVLLFVGLLGLYVEFKIPGFGLPGIVGVICLMLVLFGSYAVGLASVIELLMIAIGLILLAAEVFVIPGFGIAGISGIVLILLGMLLSFQKGLVPETPFETEILRTNIVVLVVSFLVFVAAAVLLARYLPKTKQFSKIALEGPMAGTVHGDAAGQAKMREFVGKAGVALTTLHPAGKARIEGKLVDVVTQGDFLDKDAKVRVLRVEGNRIIVEPETGGES